MIGLSDSDLCFCFVNIEKFPEENCSVFSRYSYQHSVAYSFSLSIDSNPIRQLMQSNTSISSCSKARDETAAALSYGISFVLCWPEEVVQGILGPENHSPS